MCGPKTYKKRCLCNMFVTITREMVIDRLSFQISFLYETYFKNTIYNFTSAISENTAMNSEK